MIVGRDIHIIATRKVSTAVKQEAAERRVFIDDSDFLDIQYLSTPSIADRLSEDLGPYIFTSQHAVRSFFLNEERYPTLKHNRRVCFCIAGKEERLLLDRGFEVLGVASNASLLSQKIIDMGIPSVLHLTANIKRKELYGTLAKENIKIHSLEIYKKELVPLKKEGYEAVTFFSPSQIDAFLLKNKLSSEIPAFCIGRTTAGHLKDLLHKNIIVSMKPTEDMVFEQVYKYYNRSYGK